MRLTRLVPKAVFKEDIGQLVVPAAPWVGPGRRPGRLARAAGSAGSISGAVKRLLRRSLPAPPPWWPLSLPPTACDTLAVRGDRQLAGHQAGRPQRRAARLGRQPVLCAAFDNAELQSNGATVTVAGDATGTYSTAWVARSSSGMVDAA